MNNFQLIALIFLIVGNYTIYFRYFLLSHMGKVLSQAPSFFLFQICLPISFSLQVIVSTF